MLCAINKGVQKSKDVQLLISNTMQYNASSLELIKDLMEKAETLEMLS